MQYKEVMKQYNLGPNGGIMTSLNLFATKFDQVLELLEKRSSDYKYVHSFYFPILAHDRNWKNTYNLYCVVFLPFYIAIKSYEGHMIC